MPAEESHPRPQAEPAPDPSDKPLPPWLIHPTKEDVFLRAVIFANGRLSPPIPIQLGDLLIAADGGARRCLEQGLIPASVIGDLDSLEPADLEILKACGAQIIAYPSRKDFTDLELALQFACDRQAEEILVLGALGERWDQTIANLLLPVLYCSVHIRLLDGPQEILFLRGGEQLEIRGNPGDAVSLIPLGGDAHGISTQDLEYPLNHETLFFGSTRGVSNVLLAGRATISLEEGLLLCTIIHSA
jgi:thiamine pyrophosphokinase